jgi:excisionase family DNA binding protein
MSKPKREATTRAAERGKKPTESRGVEITVNGIRVEVSPELEAAVQRACKAAARPLPAEMTTTQAAEFLDVSRPFIIKLVRRGELPCRMVGTHRRIPSASLVEQREKMFQRARKAVDEMAQIARDLGIDDLEGPPPKGR